MNNVCHLNRRSIAYLSHCLIITITCIQLSPLLASKGNHYTELVPPAHTTYTTEEYPGGDWSNQFASDRSGNLFVANGKGLLKFDGENWELMPTSGYPVFTTGVTIDSKERIWISGAKNIGYYLANTTGEYEFFDMTASITQLEHEKFGPFWRLCSDKTAVYLISSHYVLRWDGSKWDTWAFETERRILHSMVDETLYIHSRGQGFYRFDGEEFELLTDNENQCSSGIISVVAHTSEGLLCASVSDGLFYFKDNVFTPWEIEINESLKETIIYTAKAPLSNRIALGTTKGAFFISSDGTLISRLSSNNQAVYCIHLDKGQNLWLGGTDDIHRIPNLAISVHEAELINDIKRYQNQIYYVDRRGVKTFEPIGSNHVSLQATTVEEIDSVFQAEVIQDSLFYGGFENISIIQNHEIVQKIQHPRHVLNLVRSQHDPDLIYINDNPAISRLRKVDGKWGLDNSMTSRPAHYLSMIPFANGNLLVTSEASSVHEITWPTEGTEGEAQITPWMEDKGLPKQFQWSYLLEAEGNIILITNLGLYRYDSKAARFHYDPVLGDALGQDSYALESTLHVDGHSWILNLPTNTNQTIHTGIGLLRLENDQLHWEPWQLPALTRVGDIKSLYHEKEGTDEILWVGGAKALLRYNLSQLSTPPRMHVGLSEISESVSNTTLYGGGGAPPEQSEWSYPQRDLYFEFAARPHPLERKSYESRLVGFETNWFDSGDRNFRNYTNLPEGEYTFEVRPIDELGRHGSITFFSFRILPPWYRTWPSYLGYALILAGLIYLSFRWWSIRLRQRNVELEAIVNQRTAELEERNDELQEANNVKQDFLASMSHEIRNPLNGILGIARLMHEDLEYTQGEQERVNHLYNCAKHLHGLLGEVLDYSKLESGKMKLNPTPFDAARLLDEVVSMHREQAEEKALSLSLDVPEIDQHWISEPTLLRQIVINLITNAIKYTDAGWIRVSLSYEAAEGNTVLARFRVEDSGPGIPKDKQKLIFEKFTRLTPTGDNTASGTGLGLAIASETARHLGGSLSLETERVSGACFILELPLPVGKPIDRSAKKDSSNREDILQNQRILIVDDMDFNRFVSREVVERMGGIVDEAKNGTEAVERIQTGRYSLAILDIHMPDISGMDVVRQCLADESIRPPTFIALSAYDSNQIESQCLAAGFNFFLEKPLDPEGFLSVLKGVKLKRGPKKGKGDLLAYLSGSDQGNKIMQRFINSCLEQAEELATHIQAKDLTAQHGCIHKLKGLISLRKDEKLMDQVTQISASASDEAKQRLCNEFIEQLKQLRVD